jgi:predicted nucleotidyltransferase
MSLELEEAERFRFHRLSREEKERIVETLRRALEERSEVMLAVLYGSLLRETSFRDVDVAVYLKENLDPLDYQLTLSMELEKLLSLPVDAKVLNNAPPWFLKKILEEGRVLVEKAPFTVEKLYLKALDEINMLKA